MRPCADRLARARARQRTSLPRRKWSPGSELHNFQLGQYSHVLRSDRVSTCGWKWEATLSKPRSEYGRLVSLHSGVAVLDEGGPRARIEERDGPYSLCVSEIAFRNDFYLSLMGIIHIQSFPRYHRREFHPLGSPFQPPSSSPQARRHRAVCIKVMSKFGSGPKEKQKSHAQLGF
jgi:hypothetical protein